MKKYYIGESRIQGKGVFIKENLKSDEFVGIAFILKNKVINPDNDIKRTLLGKYINHSDNPNTKVVKTDSNIILHTIKNIKANTELTVNYNSFSWDGERDFLQDKTNEIK